MLSVCFHNSVSCSKRVAVNLKLNPSIFYILSLSNICNLHRTSSKDFFSLCEKKVSFALLIRQLLHLALFTGFARQSGEDLSCTVSLLLNFERCDYSC